jgi:GNAT superfamily N-acetyltransferase
MNLRLRTPSTAELETLSRLCLRSKAHWGYDPAFLRACAAELSLSPGDLLRSRVAMAECGGEALGVVQVTVSGEGADLDKLFVAPGHMGRGIGSRLFDWAATVAREEGAYRLRIEADPGAVPFYRAMGAVVVGDALSGSIPERMLPLLERVLSA